MEGRPVEGSSTLARSVPMPRSSPGPRPPWTLTAARQRPSAAAIQDQRRGSV